MYEGVAESFKGTLFPLILLSWGLANSLKCICDAICQQLCESYGVTPKCRGEGMITDVATPFGMLMYADRYQTVMPGTEVEGDTLLNILLAFIAFGMMLLFILIKYSEKKRKISAGSRKPSTSQDANHKSKKHGVDEIILDVHPVCPDSMSEKSLEYKGSKARFAKDKRRKKKRRRDPGSRKYGADTCTSRATRKQPYRYQPSSSVHHTILTKSGCDEMGVYPYPWSLTEKKAFNDSLSFNPSRQ